MNWYFYFTDFILLFLVIFDLVCYTVIEVTRIGRDMILCFYLIQFHDLSHKCQWTRFSSVCGQWWHYTYHPWLTHIVSLSVSDTIVPLLHCRFIVSWWLADCDVGAHSPVMAVTIIWLNETRFVCVCCNNVCSRLCANCKPLCTMMNRHGNGGHSEKG